MHVLALALALVHQPDMTIRWADLFTDADGGHYLFWKDDSNGIWPRPLAMLLHERPELIDRFFDQEEDKRSAAFAAAIVAFANTRRPMERFFLMNGMIEAALANWQAVKSALVEYGLAAEILAGEHATCHGGMVLLRT